MYLLLNNNHDFLLITNDTVTEFSQFPQLPLSLFYRTTENRPALVINYPHDPLSHTAELINFLRVGTKPVRLLLKIASKETVLHFAYGNAKL